MGLRSRPAAGSHEQVGFRVGRRLTQGLAAKGKGPKVYRRVLWCKAALTGLCPGGWGKPGHRSRGCSSESHPSLAAQGEGGCEVAAIKSGSPPVAPLW